MPQHYYDLDVQEQVLKITTSINDALLPGTSHSLKLTVENIFQLLTVSTTKTVKLLAGSGNATALGASENLLDRPGHSTKPRSGPTCCSKICFAHAVITGFTSIQPSSHDD
jgi:hypothetical protein